MNKLQRLYYTLEAVGWDNVPRRVLQMLRGKSGAMQRRLPGGELADSAWRDAFAGDFTLEQADAAWRARAARMFPHLAAGVLPDLPGRVIDGARRDQCVRQAAQALNAGRVPFFSRHWPEMGNPPRFNRNPIDGVDWPTGRHWSTYDSFNPELRDIKLVWEASRFSWAFVLARSHRRDRGNDDAAELFWTWLDAWDQQNPYGMTANWACGQEASFRAFGWIFAACATLDHPAATPRRLHRLTQLIWYTARHVDGNINYARSQKNNHAVSEAVALWTIGRLFPEFRAAPRWAAKGMRILEAELQRQIYADGSYVQHSHNYHRVMLDDVLWAGVLARTIGEPLSSTMLDAIERAHRWLLEMIDPTTGRVPNHGANDGALVLPLSTCDYLDYRPTAQAVNYMLHGKRCFEPGPWDETVCWLFGSDALAAPVEPLERRRFVRFDDGGYYLSRGPRSWSMIRCARYHDRPTQADQLHLDLWTGGVNLLRDAGSFQYYCDAPWQHYFLSTAAHNTLEVDGQDQMIKGPRFLWLRRAHGRTLLCGEAADGRTSWFVGEHSGYTRLPGRVVHRRSMVRIDDAYIVLDEALGAGEHEVSLRWRLCDADWAQSGDAWTCSTENEIPARGWRIQFAAPPRFSCELFRGSEHPVEGWESLYYAERTPIPVLRVTGRSRLPLRIATLIAPPDSPCEISLHADGAVLVRGISLSGAPTDLPIRSAEVG